MKSLVDSLLKEKADSNAWADEVCETTVQTYLFLELDVLTGAFCTPTSFTVRYITGVALVGPDATCLWLLSDDTRDAVGRFLSHLPAAPSMDFESS